jgi:hypothetical protein
MGIVTYLLVTVIAFLYRPLALVILFIVPFLFVVPAFFGAGDDGGF